MARRDVVGQFLGWLACLPFAGAIVSMVRRRDSGRPPRRVRVVPEYRDGLVVTDEVIVSRGAGASPAVFSSSCPHLGCRISRVDRDHLVCPCHGSRFNRDGSVAAGPASRHLTPLEFTVEPSTGALVIDVS